MSMKIFCWLAWNWCCKCWFHYRYVLVVCNLNVHQLRGQCYDGASVMSGVKNGVVAQIQTMEPKAIYAQCYGHTLQDTIVNVWCYLTLLLRCLIFTKEGCIVLKAEGRVKAWIAWHACTLSNEMLGLTHWKVY